EAGFPEWTHGGYFLAVPSRALRPVWRCPKCGARLISRNLSHSCGRFTLEALLASSDPPALTLARKYVAILRSLGDVQVIPQKTRLVACARVRFAGFEPRRSFFVATFALQRWLKSPRIIKTVDYGPRWRMHYVRVQSAADLDDQFRAWLQESHDVVGMQCDLGSGTRAQARQNPSRARTPSR